MMRSPLSALLTAALATAVLFPASAQQTMPKPPTKAAPSSSTPPKKTATTPKAPPKPAPAPAPGVDNDVVGIVNAKNITWGQVIGRLKQENPAALNASIGQAIATQAMTALYGAKPKDSFTITRAEAMQVLRQHPTKPIVDQLELMLNEEAINQQTAKEGAEPTVMQLDLQIHKLLDGLRGKDPSFPPAMSDDDFLKSKNVTREKMRENIRVRTRILNLVDKDLARKLGHPFRADDLIQASHLLIEVKAPAPDAKPEDRQKADADALARINAIADTIKSGKKTFDQAAKESSEDPGSKETGGDLGVFIRGTMVKEFENAAFAAKPGVLTGPVRSQFGYHLILVTKQGGDMPAEDRQKFLDDYETKQLQPYLFKLTGEMNKVVNRLAALMPQQPGVGMMPGGAR